MWQTTMLAWKSQQSGYKKERGKDRHKEKSEWCQVSLG